MNSPASTLDEVMSRLELDPTLPSPGDIDKLIAYYRQRRAEAQASPSGRIKREVNPSLKIDLEAIGIKPKAPMAVVRRR